MALTHPAETYRRRASEQLRKARKNLSRARRQAAVENAAELHAVMERAQKLTEKAERVTDSATGSG